MLKNLVQTVIQSTAEVAAHQDQALSVTTNRAKSEIEELSVLAGETGATIAELKESIVSDTSPKSPVFILIFSVYSSQQLFLLARDRIL